MFDRPEWPDFEYSRTLRFTKLPGAIWHRVATRRVAYMDVGYKSGRRLKFISNLAHPKDGPFLFNRPEWPDFEYSRTLRFTKLPGAIWHRVATRRVA